MTRVKREPQGRAKSIRTPHYVESSPTGRDRNPA